MQPKSVQQTGFPQHGDTHIGPDIRPHIRIAADVTARVMAEAAMADPLECCGLLLGRGDTIERIAPARNVAEDPSRHFEIDPQALIDACRAERNGGAMVLGYYHSHPSGMARPSATDRAQAAHDGRIWAIAVPPRPGTSGDVTFWHDDETAFIRLSPEIIAG